MNDAAKNWASVWSSRLRANEFSTDFVERFHQSFRSFGPELQVSMGTELYERIQELSRSPTADNTKEIIELLMKFSGQPIPPPPLSLGELIDRRYSRQEDPPKQ